MQNNLSLIRVFLASPGDLGAERQAARDVVEELNSLWFNDLGYHIYLMGWEDTVAGIGRPQEIINKQLETAEYFIGMVWEKWGTPPSKTGKYKSGFEEEFQLSLEWHRKSNKPQISLFFKEPTEGAEKDPGPQFELVQSFKKNIIDSKELYYEIFKDYLDFTTKLRRALTNYVKELKNKEYEINLSENTKNTNLNNKEIENLPANNSGDASEGLFSTEGNEFIQTILQNKSLQDVSLIDAARFRLLGSVLPGNSEEIAIGVHDANRIYSAGTSITMGPIEKYYLLRRALINYPVENVPLWTWLKDAKAKQNLIFWQAQIERNKQLVIGALSAMRDIALPIPEKLEESRQVVLGRWFNDGTDSDIKVAALNYLSDHGYVEDIPTIEAEYHRDDHKTTSAAIEALMSLKMRNSRSEAFDYLSKIQADFFPDKLIKKLFENTSGVSDNILIELIAHKNDKVKFAATDELFKRDSLTEDLSLQILKTGTPQQRFIALKLLFNAGHTYSDKQASDYLIISNPFSKFSPDSTDQKLYNEYLDWKIRNTKDNQIKESSSKLRMNERLEIQRRKFKLRGNELRQNVLNGFSTYFKGIINDLETNYGSDDKIITDSLAIKDYWCNKNTSNGLDIICEKGGENDLTLVRTVLDKGTINPTIEQYLFLAKHGEWEDIYRISNSFSNEFVFQPGKTILSFGDNQESSQILEVAANAILRIGRKREAEILRIKLPSNVLKHILFNISSGTIRTINQEIIFKYLTVSDADIRRIFCLRLVAILPTSALKEIRDVYVSRDTYFYNVVFFLDLGIGLQKQVAVEASKRILNRSLN